MMLNFAGACVPENINKIENQNKSSGSLGGSVHSHEILHLVMDLAEGK